MRKINQILIFVIIILISCEQIYDTDPTYGCHHINACNYDPVSDNNEGHYYHKDYCIYPEYGECFGESCVEIFKIDNQNLWEDINDTYPSSSNFYIGDFYNLNDNLFDQISNLINYFPLELLDEESIVIGMPDYADGGGLYIEYHYFGEHKFWLIDQIKINVPDYLHDFIDLVNEKITIINS